MLATEQLVKLKVYFKYIQKKAVKAEALTAQDRNKNESVTS